MSLRECVPGLILEYALSEAGGFTAGEGGIYRFEYRNSDGITYINYELFFYR